jgi:hypothetical protein
MLQSTSPTPIILPPAYAEGAERGASAQSHRQPAFYIESAPCEDQETESHRALWRAVISQQIMDAKNVSNKSEKKWLKSQALHWLFHNNTDFRMVCDLAGWDPDYVRSLCVTAQGHGFRRRMYLSKRNRIKRGTP